ncbi:sulfatase [Bacteroidota bacterium]
MKDRSPRLFKVLLCTLIVLLPMLSCAEKSKKPNIVVILTDDQGYADISYNPLHPPEVSTPNMDKLAREGVFFTQGYISGNVCSPTRAGLMLGRYQQRVGVYTAGEGGTGFSPEEKIFPRYLKEAGYVSGAFGKWHLGLTPAHNPVNRGFDEFYGFMGRGAHDYYRLNDPERPMYRNLEVIGDTGYLTNRLTEEAVDFIQNHKSETFFLYLAYNAVHAPKQAPTEDIKKFDTGDPDRDILMAMLKHLDDGVGEVVETLKKEGVWENTLLFFLTDNGGAKTMHAVNTPLRAWKQWNYEGGIRTPFIVSWPARFSGAREIHTPVISLDILPTVLDAAGIKAPEDKSFDGKSILPVLEGKKDVLHQNLFWSEGGGSGEWAVRSGDWKLVVHKDKIELFDLKNDVGEKTDLSAKNPDVVNKLTALYDEWLDEMAEPMHEPGKRWIPVEK